MIKKFNNLPNEVKKSVADQLKLLSWALSGVNGYFRHSLGGFLGTIFVIFGWSFLQFLAHYLVYKSNSDEEVSK
jgi:hypothetical protein